MLNESVELSTVDASQRPTDTVGVVPRGEACDLPVGVDVDHVQRGERDLLPRDMCPLEAQLHRGRPLRDDDPGQLVAVTRIWSQRDGEVVADRLPPAPPLAPEDREFDV